MTIDCFSGRGSRPARGRPRRHVRRPWVWVTHRQTARKSSDCAPNATRETGSSYLRHQGNEVVQHGPLGGVVKLAHEGRRRLALREIHGRPALRVLLRRARACENASVRHDTTRRDDPLSLECLLSVQTYISYTLPVMPLTHNLRIHFPRRTPPWRGNGGGSGSSSASIVIQHGTSHKQNERATQLLARSLFQAEPTNTAIAEGGGR